MDTDLPEWTYAPNVDPRRASRLRSVASFDAVIQALERSVVIQGCWSQFHGCPLRGCRRVEFRLAVTPETYDAFFNSPVGYRSQYARSPACGETANRRLIDALKNRLIAHRGKGFCTTHATEASLQGEDAKVWIDEEEVVEQLGREEAELLFPPWTHSESGVGCLVPVGTRLEVKGSWIDKAGCVVPNPLKKNRSHDIHNEGFSRVVP